MSPLPVLENLVIATPCKAPWSAMSGDDRVRFCHDCRLNVYNLSAMTRAEAEALVREKEGRLCVRFYRRKDGTVLTRDCPGPLFAARSPVDYLGRSLGALWALLLTFAVFTASRPRAFGEESALRRIEPFKTVLEWLNPAPRGVNPAPRWVVGEALPAVPPPVPPKPPVAPFGPPPQPDCE